MPSIALTLIGPPLAKIALRFGPPEYFALMLVGIMVLTFLSSGSMVKALMTAAVGLLLAGVGMDPISGKYRFTFNLQILFDGVGLVPTVMGLFGIAEVLTNLETEIKRDILTDPGEEPFPHPQGLGAIPYGPSSGGRSWVSSSASSPEAEPSSPLSPPMPLRRRCPSIRRSSGRGPLQGVAGPEAANNAAAGGSFIPLLTLGIPANAIMAILLGALMIHGLQPGPLLMTRAPDVFWGTIVSMYIGNAMLLVLNLPLIGLLGAGSEGPLLPALPADPPVLHDRILQHRQQHGGRVLMLIFRDRGIPDEEIPLRCPAAGPGTGAGR